MGNTVVENAKITVIAIDPDLQIEPLTRSWEWWKRRILTKTSEVCVSNCVFLYSCVECVTMQSGHKFAKALACVVRHHSKWQSVTTQVF
ncbi:hypothetical protein K9N68_16410 [Kovacikia minuta CCNUW1]|uniref:hypothetical protein n=1 Tax=Kovacikia minuta TaxID=2931930 RepID=UPI001CCEC400|nr:hypothetical protein [Kovacikia minuta]UBF29272.1 hypothetical protein K9N68_16410 [Kovacikia minuta CCNUW1]